MTSDTLITVDRIAMLVGGGLILIGVAVLGFINVITNNPHVEVVEEGTVVAEPLISADIRAYIIALGLVVLLFYGLYKVVTTPGDDLEDEQAGVTA